MELFMAELERITARIQSLPRHVKSSSGHKWMALSAALGQLEILVNELESSDNTAETDVFCASTRDLPNPDTSSSIRIPLSELGDKLVDTLGIIISQNSNTAKISLKDIEFDDIKLGENLKPLQHDQQFAVKYHRSDDPFCSHLHLDRCTRLSLPTLHRDAIKPCDESFDTWFKDLLHNPPTKRIPYYVGPLEGTFAQHLQNLFPSGHRVSELMTESSGKERHFPGVSSLYGHIGEALSGTAFHCEDANLRSYNLTLFGWKTWILIEPSHTTLFEKFIQQLQAPSDDKNPNRCDQFVRHNALLIHPEKLRSEDIHFSVIHSGPGDLVLTQPRQYHAVINRTASFAIATNFTLAHEDPVPKKLWVCSDDAFYHVKDQRICKLHQPGKKNPRQIAAAASAAQHVVPLKRSHKNISRDCSVETLPVMAALTCWMQSTAPILRFISLVRVWRSDSSLRESCLKIQSLQGGGAEIVEALSRLNSEAHGYSRFYSFLEVLVSVRFSRSLITTGRKRASKTIIENVLRARKLEASPQNRKLFQNELSHYRCWDRFCGEAPDYPYEGILCFLPLGFSDETEVRRNDIRDLAIPAYKSFHFTLGTTLPYISGLCQVGKRFQNAVFGVGELGEQPFEHCDQAEGTDLSKLSLKDLLRLIGLPQDS
ncbi:hypothetical protein QBC36DRAFT_339907 [Triangularia setosa]|uniref:JmjC domain-containing protein n=1 Tax=Triangularia setosa TaxID=2587417 RepID=A0AAN6W0G7_9PEZI|nr:hypothetical protein QBC36DRAFT_339907 [Podospora setosa]